MEEIYREIDRVIKRSVLGGIAASHTNPHKILEVISKNKNEITTAKTRADTANVFLVAYKQLRDLFSKSTTLIPEIFTDKSILESIKSANEDDSIILEYCKLLQDLLISFKSGELDKAELDSRVSRYKADLLEELHFSGMKK